MLKWTYIFVTMLVAFCTFGWGIDDEDPNSFPKFLICVILTIIMFCLGCIIFPDLYRDF